MTEKLKMKTADMASENFEKLKALFPNCVTESLDKDGPLSQVKMSAFNS